MRDVFVARRSSRARGSWRQRLRPVAQTQAIAQPPPLPPPPSSIVLNAAYPGLRQIRADPDIYIVEDFLPASACSNLIECALPYMRKSGMAFGGSEAAQNIRTSSTVLLQRSRPQIQQLLANITRLLGKPAAHCEDAQCSRYNPGEFYKAHFDGPHDTEPSAQQFLACGGSRLATVLVYLNSVNRGGATHFPTLGIEVTPQRGRALIFFPGFEDGSIDERLIHEALPAGDVKFVSQVWVRHGADRFGMFMNTRESV